MHIIIGGCGRVGAELAERLSADEHDVVVIDEHEESFDRLGGAFNGETLVGDVTDKDLLVRAGVEHADGLVAVTNFDNANLMAVEIAKELFGVRHTVARLFNPDREESYRKMGVRYVSGTRMVAKSILNELHAGTFPLHVAFDDGDVEIVEMRVTKHGHGVTVAELEDTGRVRVAAYRRGMRVRIPRLDDRLQEGDLLVSAIGKGGVRQLRDLVAHPFTEEA